MILNCILDLKQTKQNRSKERYCKRMIATLGNFMMNHIFDNGIMSHVKFPEFCNSVVLYKKIPLLLEILAAVFRSKEMPPETTQY